MKVSRYKKLRKILQYYRLHHSFVPPYRVLIDPDFLTAARDGRIMLKDQLPKLFDSEVSIHISSCCLAYLNENSQRLGAELFIAKSLEIFRCSHPHQTQQSASHLLPTDCCSDLLARSNPHRFICGAQNSKLREFVRTQNGVPLMFIRGAVPVLEKANFGLKQAVKRQEQRKMNSAATEEELEAASAAAELLRESDPRAAEEERRKNHTRKKAKGPNPLSMKKTNKNKNQNKEQKQRTNEKKRKRTEESQETSENQIKQEEKQTEASEGGKRKRPRTRKRSKETSEQVSQ
jgi:U3 small nucleolar RNA-associated protein 23